jgi:hypothetical protein
MDMSFFRRPRGENRSPELQLLLAEAASRQSQSPTAMAFCRPDAAIADPSLPSEIAFLIGSGQAANPAAPAHASFSPSVAKALVTGEKSL